MKVAVTGTPGTGKTTATERLGDDYAVVHLNDAIREAGLHEGTDEDRDSLVADLAAVREWFEGRVADLEDDAEAVVVESHLAHHLPVDRVVVLRCHPDELRRRLRERGAGEPKVAENAESEALDLVLAEAVAERGADATYEVDATDLSPDAVADAVRAVVAGERAPSAGTVSFVEAVEVGDEGIETDDIDADGSSDGTANGNEEVPERP